VSIELKKQEQIPFMSRVPPHFSQAVEGRAGTGRSVRHFQQ